MWKLKKKSFTSWLFIFDVLFSPIVVWNDQNLICLGWGPNTRKRGASTTGCTRAKWPNMMYSTVNNSPQKLNKFHALFSTENKYMRFKFKCSECSVGLCDDTCFRKYHKNYTAEDWHYTGKRRTQNVKYLNCSQSWLSNLNGTSGQPDNNKWWLTWKDFKEAGKYQHNLWLNFPHEKLS
jgi:hypothetical protein